MEFIQFAVTLDTMHTVLVPASTDQSQNRPGPVYSFSERIASSRQDGVISHAEELARLAQFFHDVLDEYDPSMGCSFVCEVPLPYSGMFCYAMERIVGVLGAVCGEHGCGFVDFMPVPQFMIIAPVMGLAKEREAPV